MADMRFLESDHQRAEFRQAEPLRHLAAQHAALGLGTDLALAGDDEHEGQAVAMGALQKAEQRAMRARLRHAVEVDAARRSPSCRATIASARGGRVGASGGACGFGGGVILTGTGDRAARRGLCRDRRFGFRRDSAPSPVAASSAAA